MNEREKFTYTYSAPTADERREIEGIRRQYAGEKEFSAFDRLKALDKKVRRVPRTVAAVAAVAGLLVFGGGMAMFMEAGMIAAGIAVAAIGALFALTAIPVFKLLRAKLKKKYAPEILRLSDDLLKEHEK